MVTGNGLTPNTDQNDVDNGFTTLISPIFNLNELTTPHLNYARSFYCFHGPNNIDDTLLITLSNGIDQVVLEEIIAPQADPMTWAYRSFALNGLLPFTNSMQLFIRTADYQGNPNITEAAFDHFTLSNEPILELNHEGLTQGIVLYPNPGQDQLFLRGITKQTLVQVYQLDGKVCKSVNISPTQSVMDTQALPNGAYIVEIEGQRISWVKLGQ